MRFVIIIICYSLFTLDMLLSLKSCKCLSACNSVLRMCNIIIIMIDQVSNQFLLKLFLYPRSRLSFINFESKIVKPDLRFGNFIYLHNKLFSQHGAFSALLSLLGMYSGY